MRFLRLAILAALAAIVLLAYSDPRNPSFATSPPSAQRFSIDTDPYFTTSNTATSLGTLESCAAMVENNVLDADEDFVDTIELDVTATGIPAQNPLMGYSYSLSYPSPSTRVIYQQPMMIGSPIGVQNSSDPLPDTDGNFNVSVVDLTGPAESGSGVLDRIQIQTVPPVMTGVFPVVMNSAAHIDTNGLSYAPDALDSAMIELNTGGCSLLVDIELVSMSLVSVNPIAVGAYSNLGVDTTIRNNSPYAANTYVESTFNVPSDCTVNGSGGNVVVNTPAGVLAGGATIGVHQEAALRCTVLGPHTMPVTACGLLGEPSYLDVQAANDCQTQNLNFDVGTLPGGDSDGDGYSDQAEAGTPLCGDGRNEDGVIAGGASDDAVTDDDCLGGPPKAGAFSEAQFNIGTSPTDACGTDGNPADLVSGGVPDSTNRINILDLTSFLAPTRRLGTSPGHAAFNQRWDVVPGRGLFNTWINVADLTSIITVAPLASPWNGSRAFGGPACGGIPPF